MANLDFTKLSEDIVRRNMQKESARLTEKWDRTGLLKGLNDTQRNNAKSNMARLLESQAAELLKESSDTGDIKGFQNIAFPIVRRVFGGLIANELVSVQPMSLPAGLLFYLDYTYGTVKGGNQALDWAAGGSVYGDQTGPTNTVPLTANGSGGPYYLASSYSNRELNGAMTVSASGSATWANVNYDMELSGAVAAGTLKYVEIALTTSLSPTVTTSTIDETNYKNFTFSGSGTQFGGVKAVYKRHNTYDATTGKVTIYYSGSATVLLGTDIGLTGSFVTKSGLTVDSTGTVFSPVFESDFSTDIIPEIDIRVQSVAVTADSRKLKAKWTPELAQDLNAYQNIDAEVELTQILSEQIALDIDREILQHLLQAGTGATMYWSRKPGDFVNKFTGLTTAGSFTGTIREWYEGLVETCIDVANTIHRKTLRGAANFMVVSPDVATLFEASMLYKPTLSLEPTETQFSLGIEKAGTLNNRFTVYKDPYFPRNLILVGYKGSSFLETGYVYAPYVPLIVTPTIFAPDDFTPRKGVMTRYAKKMVRSDFYGKVVILNMDVI